MAAQSGFAPVQKLLHGVTGGRPHVGPSDQERAAWAAENGGQFPQVFSVSLSASVKCCHTLHYSFSLSFLISFHLIPISYSDGAGVCLRAFPSL